jgi:type I restriction enzyme S subunit
MYGSIGKLGIAGIPCATNQAIAFTSGISDAVVPQYLFRYLQAAKPFLFEQGKGGAQANISQTVLKAFPIALAPLAEQRRIVGKVEAVLQRLNACQRRLANAPVLLKRFRQSILAAACSGRLTASWRDESITAEGNGLPVGWKSVCVGDVIESIKYGTSQKCTYERRGVPVLRIPNVVNGTIDRMDLKYADLPTQARRNLQLCAGDILLIRSNGSVSLVGKCAVVKESERGFAYAGYLIRIRPNNNIARPDFLNLVLGSYDIRLQIELQARSTSGVNNINAEEVRALHFLLPPIPEQEAIIHRVKSLFAVASKLEARYAEATSYVGRFAPSILAKAFRGELANMGATP